MSVLTNISYSILSNTDQYQNHPNIFVCIYTHKYVDRVLFCVYKYTCRIWKGIRNGFSKAYPDVAG